MLIKNYLTIECCKICQVNLATVVEVWKQQWQNTLQHVTALGLKSFLSSPWYLNRIQIGADWDGFNNVEPTNFNCKHNYAVFLGGLMNDPDSNRFLCISKLAILSQVSSLHKSVWGRFCLFVFYRPNGYAIQAISYQPSMVSGYKCENIW